MEKDSVNLDFVWGYVQGIDRQIQRFKHALTLAALMLWAFLLGRLWR